MYDMFNDATRMDGKKNPKSSGTAIDILRSGMSGITKPGTKDDPTITDPNVGATTGAIDGAIAGSTIMPGWGTLAGGAAGAVSGYLQAYIGGKEAKRKEEEKRKKEEAALRQKTRIENAINIRAQESHDQTMAQNDIKFNSGLKAEGRNDSFYLNSLKSLGG